MNIYICFMRDFNLKVMFGCISDKIIQLPRLIQNVWSNSLRNRIFQCSKAWEICVSLIYLDLSVINSINL